MRLPIASLAFLQIAAYSQFVRQNVVSALHQEYVRTAVAKGVPVRTIFFDKTPATNWKVPWHQDLTICVKERHNLPGFTAWSIKEGVTHVQPPTEILERMFTIRLHLDHCGPENGPLRVLPGSHKHGRLTPQQISRFQSETEPVTCIVPQAGALLMKPLLLHSSSAATEPSHRRVLHIELASGTLPKPLAWAKQLFDSPSIAEPMIRFP